MRHLWVVLKEARNESDPESLLSDMSFGILVYEERGMEFKGKPEDWFWGKLNHFVLLLLLLLVEYCTRSRLLFCLNNYLGKEVSNLVLFLVPIIFFAVPKVGWRNFEKISTVSHFCSTKIGWRHSSEEVWPRFDSLQLTFSICSFFCYQTSLKLTLAITILFEISESCSFATEIKIKR